MLQTGVLIAAVLATTTAWGGDYGEGNRFRDQPESHRHDGDEHESHLDHPEPICGAPDLITLLDQVHASCCGFPRDAGNEVGVGKFCLTDRQCARTSATICSAAENATADHTSFYCTRICDPTAANPGCGSGASCNCEGEACVCTPTSCIQHPPEGCDGP